MSKLTRLLIILGVVVGLIGITGTAFAQPLWPRPQNRAVGGVIAIGQLTATDGTIQTIDLRAGERNNRQGGNLRFYDPKMGYYNGAVRSVSLQPGTASVSGGGILNEPGGTRERVQFTMTVDQSTKHVTINVQDRSGQTYTIDGNLSSGFVVVLTPTTTVTPSPSPSPSPTAS